MYVLSNKVYLCICAKCIMKFKPRLLRIINNRQMQTRKNKNKQTNKTGALMHHNCARNIRKCLFPDFRTEHDLVVKPLSQDIKESFCYITHRILT